jgi:hypothetical protein
MTKPNDFVSQLAHEAAEKIVAALYAPTRLPMAELQEQVASIIESVFAGSHVPNRQSIFPEPIPTEPANTSIVTLESHQTSRKTWP